MSQLTFLRNLAITTLAVIAMTVGSATTALPLQTANPPAQTESVTAKATIEAIDKTNRLITLKGPRGNLAVVKAGETVKRFDELKVGDIITATYTESLAIHVRKPGETAPKEMISNIDPRKARPGSTVTEQYTISVTIEEIDRDAPSVTVRGPEGRVLSFRVGDAKNLVGLKVGDQVDITHTIALLLQADPAVK